MSNIDRYDETIAVAPSTRWLPWPARSFVGHFSDLGARSYEVRFTSMSRHRECHAAIEYRVPSRRQITTSPSQNKNGLTETMILPSAVCCTLKSTSFSAVASAMVTDNSPMQVTSLLLDFSNS